MDYEKELNRNLRIKKKYNKKCIEYEFGGDLKLEEAEKFCKYVKDNGFAASVKVPLIGNPWVLIYTENIRYNQWCMDNETTYNLLGGLVLFLTIYFMFKVWIFMNT